MTRLHVYECIGRPPTLGSEPKTSRLAHSNAYIIPPRLISYPGLITLTGGHTFFYIGVPVSKTPEHNIPRIRAVLTTNGIEVSKIMFCPPMYNESWISVNKETGEFTSKRLSLFDKAVSFFNCCGNRRGRIPMACVTPCSDAKEEDKLPDVTPRTSRPKWYT